jgi:hypothetical protein
MKSGKRKIGMMCALAAAAISLSLAAASLTPAAAQEQKWCVNSSGTNTCYPTLAACEAANPGRACVKGAS